MGLPIFISVIGLVGTIVAAVIIYRNRDVLFTNHSEHDK